MFTSTTEYMSKKDTSQHRSVGALVHVLILHIIGKVNNFDLGEDKGPRRRRSVFVGMHNRRWFRSTNPATVRTIMTETVASMSKDIFCVKVLFLVFFMSYTT
jgi:hypothetical protein